MKILLMMLLLFTLNLFANDKLSKDQLSTLNDIRDIAIQIKDVNGQSYEDTLCAICLTESSADQRKVKNYSKQTSLQKSSFGIMQMRLQTVRFIASKIPNMKSIKQLSDHQLAQKLIDDPKFSATMATHFFIYLQNTRKNYMQSVSGYNGGTINKPYYEKVMKNLEIVKSLEKENK